MLFARELFAYWGVPAVDLTDHRIREWWTLLQEARKPEKKGRQVYVKPKGRSAFPKRGDER